MTLELDEQTRSRLPVPDRHCGRCQSGFPGDPTLYFQTDWALCPACAAILLPGRPAAPPGDSSPTTTPPLAWKLDDRAGQVRSMPPDETGIDPRSVLDVPLE